MSFVVYGKAGICYGPFDTKDAAGEWAKTFFYVSEVYELKSPMELK